MMGLRGNALDANNNGKAIWTQKRACYMQHIIDEEDMCLINERNTYIGDYTILIFAKDNSVCCHNITPKSYSKVYSNV